MIGSETVSVSTATAGGSVSSSEEPSDQANLQGDDLEQLMVKYQEADEEAAAELIRRLSPKLFSFLAAPLATRPYVEDVLQDCWLRIHRARHTYRPGSPVLPWLYAIARHTRTDAYRRLGKAKMLPATALDQLPDRDAEAKVLSSHADLWASVASLPKSQREVIYMVKVMGMTFDEAAQELGSTGGAVKQKAHRAYRKLQSMLVDYRDVHSRGDEGKLQGVRSSRGPSSPAAGAGAPLGCGAA